MMPRFRDQLRSVRIRPWQKLWQAWAPTNDEQDKWIALAEKIAEEEFIRGKGVISLDNVRERMRVHAEHAGVGPLTWLWIASMVIELIKLWREWKENK